MSGCALIKLWSYAKPHNPLESQIIARKLGWNGVGGEKEILDVLENADPFEIVKAFESSLSLENISQEDSDLRYCFWTVIEPYPSENCFIPKDPLLMAREAWGNDIDMMIGACASEGIFHLAFYEDLEILSARKVFSNELGLKYDNEKLESYRKQIEKLYYGFANLTNINIVDRMHVIKLV
jgi:hypothetical protein